MTDLEWHEFYEIGIDFIDDEHRKILSIMRSIQDMIVGCKLDELHKLTDHLIEESKNHFKHEEEFLEQADYPDLAEHNFYHNGLLVQATRIKEICQGINTDHDLELCFDEMKKFMVDDIMYGDIRFISYLEYRGLIPRKY